MAKVIEAQRAPYREKLAERLAVSETLLYRRGKFNGTMDQLILDALMEAKGAEIAFSPGFRWGTTIMPGDAIASEQGRNQTGITYTRAVVTLMTGETMKVSLEDARNEHFT